jgi:hypothetical protein
MAPELKFQIDVCKAMPSKNAALSKQKTAAGILRNLKTAVRVAEFRMP